MNYTTSSSSSSLSTIHHHRNDDPRDEGGKERVEIALDFIFFFFARLNNSSSEVVQPRRSWVVVAPGLHVPPPLSLNVLIKHDSIYLSVVCVCVSIPYLIVIFQSLSIDEPPRRSNFFVE